MPLAAITQGYVEGVENVASRLKAQIGITKQLVDIYVL
jgi:hypothetical protein